MRRSRYVIGAFGVGLAAMLLVAALSRPDAPDRASRSEGAGTAATSGAEVRPRLGTSDALLERAQAEVPPEPRTLRIGRLGVDVPIVPVGLEATTGELDVPRNAREVAWYRFGAAPGQPGSAVLAAHVDYDGARGVFFRLDELEAGDIASVVDADGRETRFEVTTIRHVAKGDLPVDQLFRSTGAGVLTLVTCGGEFDRTRRSYEDNVIVEAAVTT